MVSSKRNSSSTSTACAEACAGSRDGVRVAIRNPPAIMASPASTIQMIAELLLPDELGLRTFISLTFPVVTQVHPRKRVHPVRARLRRFWGEYHWALRVTPQDVTFIAPAADVRNLLIFTQVVPILHAFGVFCKLKPR